jgi:small subunit ribosomal protein SAe
MSTSSKLPSILSATEEDIQLLLAAQCHIGTKNCDKQMEPYVWKRRQDGEYARGYTSGLSF